MQGIKEIRGDDNLLMIWWQITNYCNYSCSYCPPFLHSGSQVNRLPSLEILLGFCNKLNDLISQGKKVEIDIAGGEPTTHKHIREVVNALCGMVYVGITTNGSRPTAWWKTFARLPNRVIISIHDESNMQRIIETSDWLISQNVNVQFNCSMDANNWTKSVRRYEDLRDRYGWRAGLKVINSLDDAGWQSLPQPLTDVQKAYLAAYDESKVHDPYPEHTKTVLELRNRLAGGMCSVITGDDQQIRMTNYALRGAIVRRHLNYFKGWKCNAGMSNVLVTPLGIVEGGLCRVSVLGHISNFQFATAMVTCPKASCPCPADVPISKHAPETVVSQEGIHV